MDVNPRTYRPVPLMSTISDLIQRADDAAARAHVPYSQNRAACALLLSDGDVIPGVRLESASFSLVITPMVNAFSTAAALGRDDIAAVASSETLEREDVAFLAHTFAGRFTPISGQVAIRRASDGLPDVRSEVSPLVEVPDLGDEEAMLASARELTDRAVVPASHFPVAALLLLKDGAAIPGVNTEHADWSRGICAERNALGTMVSYGLANPEHLYLTCSLDSGCTPCGACRQLLAEVAPSARIVMDRASKPPETSTPRELLPGFFAGNEIPSDAPSSVGR